jgi:hypothetical protein
MHTTLTARPRAKLVESLPRLTAAACPARGSWKPS